MSQGTGGAYGTYAYVDNQVILYSDCSFSPEIYNLSVNVEAVMNSILNILSTLPGERLNHPEFGTDLEAELFQPMDYITAQAIYTKVYDAINRWEPRVRINSKKSTVTPYYDEHVYEVQLYFYIVGISMEFNVKRFYKQRTTAA